MQFFSCSILLGRVLHRGCNLRGTCGSCVGIARLHNGFLWPGISFRLTRRQQAKHAAGKRLPGISPTPVLVCSLKCSQMSFQVADVSGIACNLAMKLKLWVSAKIDMLLVPAGIQSMRGCSFCRLKPLVCVLSPQACQHGAGTTQRACMQIDPHYRTKTHQLAQTFQESAHTMQRHACHMDCTDLAPLSSKYSTVLLMPAVLWL